MAEKTVLSKEGFLSMAKIAGLDIQDPHMEELYRYVLDLLPGLKSINDLDLTGIEPASIFMLSREL